MSTNLLTTITEKDFRQQVLDAAQLLGWKAYFTWNSLHSPSGFPDLILCRPPRIIFAELKKENGKVTPAQEEWILALGKCPGVETYLWRPSDIDTILEKLD